jgi:hypothetical protein
MLYWYLVFRRRSCPSLSTRTKIVVAQYGRFRCPPFLPRCSDIDRGCGHHPWIPDALRSQGGKSPPHQFGRLRSMLLLDARMMLFTEGDPRSPKRDAHHDLHFAVKLFDLREGNDYAHHSLTKKQPDAREKTPGLPCFSGALATLRTTLKTTAYFSCSLMRIKMLLISFATTDRGAGQVGVVISEAQAEYA